MRETIHSLIKGTLNFIYPPSCLSCDNEIELDHLLICQACLTLLELINPDERCLYCFSEQIDKRNQTCYACRNKKHSLNHLAAAFDYAGPAAMLVKKLKYSNKPFLSKSLSSYLIAQFVKLQWPIPDLVIPVPMPISHRLERGYNQSYYLARDFANMLGVPIAEALIRKSGDHSQAGLNFQQRMQLNGNCFKLKKNEDLMQDKCLLLIDDVMTTGTTLYRCAEILQENSPASIYALTVCKALKQ